MTAVERAFPIDGPDEHESLADHLEHALTAAALQTYPAGGTQRYDFGEIACQVLTVVAANVGGVEGLLAGRPDSWEADYVRHMVHATTPEDQLLGWRTDPVQLWLNPAYVLEDLGVTALYDEARAAIVGRPHVTTRVIDAELDVLDQLWLADLDHYAAAYTDAVQSAAADLGLAVEVVVDVVDDDRCEPDWDTLAAQLHDIARAVTPLPTSGLAPRDYPPDAGLPGEIDRMAGRTYLARLVEHVGGGR